MQVRKRTSSGKPVDVTKIVYAVQLAKLNGACDDRGRFGRAGVGHGKGVVTASSLSQ